MGWMLNFRLVFVAIFISFVAFAEDKPITSIKTNEKVIALTFDDGPDEGTLKLLKIFEKEGVKATFFVKGNNVKNRPDIARKTVKAGHELGNHSYTHPNFPSLTPADVRKQIFDTQKEIKKVTGMDAVIFRAPGLRYSPELWKVLNGIKMPAINASISISDWHKTKTSQQILREIKARHHSGGIVLMHSWPKPTLEIMPEVIAFLKSEGYRFVTVSELLAMQKK